MATKNSSGLVQSSSVYAYYIPSLNAIKVGFGENAAARLNQYSRQYTFIADKNTLREWILPSPALASTIETACHRALIEAGFERVSHVADEQEAQELFDLGPNHYEDATLLVAETIELTVNELHAALGALTPVKDEKTNQSVQAAKLKREKMRADRIAFEKSEFRRKVEPALTALKAARDHEFSEYVKLGKRAQILISGFPYYASPIAAARSLFGGRVRRLQKYEHWPELRGIAKKLLICGRAAKLHFIRLYIDCPYLDIAATELQWPSVDAPEGVALPFVDFHDDPLGPAHAELTRVVGMVSNLRLDDEFNELIKVEPIFSSMLTWARNNPAPELINPEFLRLRSSPLAS